ncbi:MAG: PEP-CTERM sorting domain-containing protein [Spirulina sp.]
MKVKFLTSLVATTAAIATAFIGGSAEAFNLKTSDPAFYEFLQTNYLLQVFEGQELSDHQDLAITGQITALGNEVEVYFIDDATAQADYADRLVYSVNGGAVQQGFADFGTNGLGGRLDDGLVPQEVPDGEGFTINTNAGDILDFNVWTKGFWDDPSNDGFYLGGVASENVDLLQHAVAYNLQHDGDEWVYIGFEDIPDLNFNPGGFPVDNKPDFDFNDVAIVIRNVRHVKDVPEPGVTLALLGIAAGAIGLRRRKDAA